MTTQQEHNKQIVRRFIDGYQTGRDERVLEDCVATGMVNHAAVPGATSGRDGVREIFTGGFHAAMSDFRVDVLAMFAEGDRVITHKLLRGTHDGAELMGIPATGGRMEVAVIDILRVEDGRLAEHWAVIDRLAMLQQLGALPELEAAVSR